MRAFEYIWIDFSKLEFEEMKLLLADYASAGWEVVADAPAPAETAGLADESALAVMLARPVPPLPRFQRAA
jgi:hypothetical protein